MGGNGEDTRAYTAGRVCVPEGGQEHLRIYSVGGRPAGPMQVAEGAGQAGFAALESGRLHEYSQGITVSSTVLQFGETSISLQ